MNDFNFFNEYKPKKVKKSISVRLVNLLFILVVVGIVGIATINFITLRALNEEQKSLDSEIMSIRASDDYIRALEKKGLNSRLEELVLALNHAGGESLGLGMINENLLAVISDTMPSDVALTYFAIDEGQLYITGVAVEKPAIAEYEYRLRQASFVQVIEMNDIGKDEEGLFTFSMNITIGGETDED